MLSSSANNKFQKINKQIGSNTSSYNLRHKLRSFTTRGQFSSLHQEKIINSLVGALTPLQLRILKNQNKGLAKAQINKIIKTVNNKLNSEGEGMSLHQKQKAHLLLKHLGYSQEENNISKHENGDHQLTDEQKRRNIRASRMSDRLAEKGSSYQQAMARYKNNKNLRTSVGDNGSGNESLISGNSLATPIGGNAGSGVAPADTGSISINKF